VHPQRHASLAVRLFFEVGDFEKVNALICSTDSELPRSDRRLFTQLISCLNPPPDSGDAQTPEMSCLAKEVCGRHVALVAPGRINKDLGEVIDSADLVARIQPYVRPDLDEPSRRGTRLDIAAFSSSVHVLQSSHGDMDLSHLSSCRAIIAKKAPVDGRIGGQPVRSVPPWRPILLSTPVSGTIMITEILLARPRRLDLFGFNFYADPSGYTPAVNALYASPKSPLGFPAHNKSFMLESRLPAESLARAFPSHDLFSDFLFVKRLVTSGTTVYAHGNTRTILVRTVSEYASQLADAMSSS
jgi:hypothetical protein